MLVNMRNYKSSITTLPTYLDGYFELFEIKTGDDVLPVDYLLETGLLFAFEFRSIGDRIRFEADAREIELTHKIRMDQTKMITSLHVLKIGEEFHKVFNTYHFTNKDGYKQTDITLQKYRQEIDIRGDDYVE